MALLQGDGNNNGGWTTFADVVRAALGSGWAVELWSWRKSLSKHLLKIADDNAAKVKVVYLDDLDVKRPPKGKFYCLITFRHFCQ